MNRKFVVFAALVAAFAFTSQAAQAHGPRHHDKTKLAAVAIGVGAASTAGFLALNNWRWNGWDTNGSGHGLTRLGAYGATTMACAAVSPMVATVVLERPLTMREAHTLIGSCVVPIVGGLIVNAIWDANPQWEAGAAPVRHVRHMKKMK
jgi:putative flippase GtrA